MTLGQFLAPWQGTAVRHVPHGSPYDPLDFRFSASARDNRWNDVGQVTGYFACDRGVAVAEFARHFADNRSRKLGNLARKRQVYLVDLELEQTLDLRLPAVQRHLSLANVPACFLDRGITRATASFIRTVTAAQAIFVPSIAFLDQDDRWALVVFEEKVDRQRCYTRIVKGGIFRIADR